MTPSFIPSPLGTEAPSRVARNVAFSAFFCCTGLARAPQSRDHPAGMATTGPQPIVSSGFSVRLAVYTTGSHRIVPYVNARYRCVLYIPPASLSAGRNR